MTDLRTAPRTPLRPIGSLDRVVAAGDALLAPSITRRLLEDFARVQPVLPAAAADLTPRETYVLRLVGRGQSNREIAATLVLAEQTVKTHVSRILTKLNLRDRAQAVVSAFESRGSCPRRLYREHPPLTPKQLIALN